MKKINIAELLKDCPTGMELDCSMYNKVTLLSVDDREDIVFPIRVLREDGNSTTLTKYGQFTDADFAKCVIFPKGKTTWEGFQRPFKDGDVIALDTEKGAQLFIFKEYIYNHDYVQCYMMLDYNGKIDFEIGDYYVERFATEEEKEKLFKAIKDNGYKWNEKTKTLEKLIKPIFKKGDKVRVKNGVSEPRIIDDVYNTFYTLVSIGSIDFTDQHNWELVPEKIKPKFKVGDWITNGDYTWKVISVDYLDYTLQNQLGEYVDDTIDYVNKAFHLWTIQDAKDGDVLFHSDSASNGIFIFKEILQRGTLQKVICYCDYDSEDGFCLRENHTCCWTDSKILYPATKERCNRLFQKMKEAGYRWNAGTKALEKLFPYNIGTKVWVKSDKEHKYIHTIVGISYNSFGNLEYEVKEEKTGIVVHYPKELLIPITKEPKFKVGDNIRIKGKSIVHVVTNLQGDHYKLDNKNISLLFENQDQWELVINKFDITTLKPFNKVLVRCSTLEKWRIQFFEKYDKTYPYPFICLGCINYKQCIPYEGNEHLLDTTDYCDEYYKIWE
jgi:hypothetical protein